MHQTTLSGSRSRPIRRTCDHVATAALPRPGLPGSLMLPLVKPPLVRLPLVRLLLVTASLALPAGGIARAEQPARDETAIRAAIRAYKEAFDRGDGSALATLWTPDGDIIDDDGHVFNGREAVRRIEPTAQAAGAKDSPTLELAETNLRFLTDDAVVEDGTVKVTPPGGGEPLEGWFSAVWVRHDGQWKLGVLRESRIATPRESARLSDLDWMVGDWTVVERHADGEQPADEQPQAAGPTIELSVRWNPTRTFLLRDMKITPPSGTGDTAGNAPPATLITQRIGWDPLSRQIVSWVFGSDGSHGEATWTRDDGTWVARTMAVMPDGTQTSSLNIYAYNGADRCLWRSIPTHVGSEHAPHISMTMIRKRPTGPQQGGQTR